MYVQSARRGVFWARVGVEGGYTQEASLIWGGFGDAGDSGVLPPESHGPVGPLVRVIRVFAASRRLVVAGELW